MTDMHKDQLIKDLHELVANAEALLGITRDEASADFELLRRRTSDSVNKAKDRLADLELRMQKRVKAAADGATEYVRDNPWQSLGAATALGVVLGVLLGRR